MTLPVLAPVTLREHEPEARAHVADGKETLPEPATCDQAIVSFATELRYPSRVEVHAQVSLSVEVQERAREVLTRVTFSLAVLEAPLLLGSPL